MGVIRGYFPGADGVRGFLYGDLKNDEDFDPKVHVCFFNDREPNNSAGGSKGKASGKKRQQFGRPEKAFAEDLASRPEFKKLYDHVDILENEHLYVDFCSGSEVEPSEWSDKSQWVDVSGD